MAILTLQPRSPRINATMTYATQWGLPADYFDQPLIRSYAETDARGNLFRVEVRGRDGGHKVQARFPMPHKVGGPEHRRGALTFANA